MMMMTLERRCSQAGSRRLHCPWGAQHQDGLRRRWREAPLLKVDVFFSHFWSPIGAQEVTMSIFGSLPFLALSLTPKTFQADLIKQPEAQIYFVQYLSWYSVLACAESPTICAHLLTLASLVLILVTPPLSLIYSIRVVQVLILLLHPPVERNLLIYQVIEGKLVSWTEVSEPYS